MAEKGSLEGLQKDKELKNKDVSGRNKVDNVINAKPNEAKKTKASSTINRYHPCSSCPALKKKEASFDLDYIWFGVPNHTGKDEHLIRSKETCIKV
jgi:hypothetical protein